MPGRSTSIAVAAAVLALVAAGAIYGLNAAGAPEAAALGLPAPGTPYAKARRALLARGMTPDLARAEFPHPSFPELDCPPEAQGACRALFTRKDADGWRRYLVVEAAGAPPVVTAVRTPFTAEGLLAIPPPPAADIPELPKSYFAARERLLQLGFKPAKAATPAVSVCAKALQSAQPIDCPPDLPLPEIKFCSGTGSAICEAYWLAPDRRVLRILTVYEPAPGDIYHLEWASPEQLTDLPKGWKP